MAQLLPFEFESQPIRIVLVNETEPWFNASDICQALEHGNPRQALETHVDPDDVQKLDTIDRLGRTQRANHLNESGLYSLILRSQVAKAKNFKRWVTREVLPTIRQTGVYAAPNPVRALPVPTQDRVTALLMIGEAVAKVPGVKPGIAMAAALTCIHENTGLVVETMRKALPACTESLPAMNPTQLGEQIGRSAKQVNRLLADRGFQYRNERDEWELTESGRMFGESLPFSRNGHSGYQILWNLAVVERLKEAA